MNRSEFSPYAPYVPVFIFAVAMGFLEAIVVVYIREIYYPEGFAFPLKPMETWVIGTEMVRELCTLLMLWTAAYISGKSFIQRLAAFLFLFGVWDIFYYVALWLFLGWPESLLTWDILFLIPITWTGPVLAPVLCSLLMIFIAFLLERQHMMYGITTPGKKALLLFVSGSVFIMAAFMYDFISIIFRGNYFPRFFSLAEDKEFLQAMMSYIPDRFQWEILSAGLIITGTGTLPLLKKRK